jgi:hypothetical protein
MQRWGLRSLRVLSEHAKWNGHPAVKLLLNVKRTISTSHTIIENRVGTQQNIEIKEEFPV